jgi:hypothetical protein
MDPPFVRRSGPDHPADREGDRTVNKVLLTGRLTRDPEMRSLASGKHVTTFTVASNEFIRGGREKAEYHPVVTWVTANVYGVLSVFAHSRRRTIRAWLSESLSGI